MLIYVFIYGNGVQLRIRTGTGSGREGRADRETETTCATLAWKLSGGRCGWHIIHSWQAARQPDR